MTSLESARLRHLTKITGRRVASEGAFQIPHLDHSSLPVAKLHHRPLADLHPPLVVRGRSFSLALPQAHHNLSFLQEELRFKSDICQI